MTTRLPIPIIGKRLRPARRMVPPSIFALACFVVALLVPGSGYRASAASTVTAATQGTPDRVAPSLPSGPQFRLGDAAKPFTWATVIADFNRDGLPDVALADHVGYRANGYGYRLEFSVSGQAPQEVSFESDFAALTIGVADIDYDGDFDVTVDVALSGQTVGVWLNDGHGHFSSADVRQFPAAIRPVQSVNATDPLDGPTALDVGPRRVDDGVPSLVSAVFSDSSHRLATVPGGPRLQPSILPASVSPRAPPRLSSDLS